MINENINFVAGLIGKTISILDITYFFRSSKISGAGLSPTEIAFQKGFTEVHAILKKSGVAWKKSGNGKKPGLFNEKTEAMSNILNITLNPLVTSK